MQNFLKSGSLRNLNHSLSCLQQVIINWINSFKVCKSLVATEVPEKFRNGVFPLELIQAMDPSFEVININSKPKSKKECIENLQLFLVYMAKHGMKNTSNLKDYLYQGKSMQIWEVLDYLLNEIFLKQVLSQKDDVLLWASQRLGICVDYHNLCKIFKEKTRLVAVLDYNTKRSHSPQTIPDAYIKPNILPIDKLLASLEIPVILPPAEIQTNNNNNFMYLQLYYIYKILEQKDDSTKATAVSSDCSIKSSVNFLEYSFSNDSPVNLDSMEKKVINEERKLMYISDILNNRKIDTITHIIQKSSSLFFETQLSDQEILICFLITPRVVRVRCGTWAGNCIINLIPNASKFSWKSEEYILECKDISMNNIFICEVHEIQNIQRKSFYFTLVVHEKRFEIIFEAESDCKKYFDGIKYLTKKY
jgi:Calponin homology (CH) domain